MELTLTNKITDYLGTLNFNIVGEENEGLSSALGLKSQLELLEDNADKILKIRDLDIRFEDEVWDFTSKYVEGKELSCYKIYFNLNDYYNTLLKLYSIYLLILEPNLNWIRRVRGAKAFCSFLQNKYINDIEDIEIVDIKAYIENEARRASVINLFKFYMAVTGFSFDDEIMKFLRFRDLRAINMKTMENKAKLIPQELYNYYRDRSFELLKDETVIFNGRKTAGVIFLQTQLGLRTNEILTLKEDSLLIIRRGKIKSAYVNFQSTKDARGAQGFNMHQVIANEAVEKAFAILKKMNEGKENPKKYLFLSESNSNYNPNPKRDCNYLSSSTLHFYKKKFFSEMLQEKNITYREFRVYVASEWMAQGIPTRTIQKMFGHSDQMDGYYCRSDHPLQDDLVYTKGLLKEIIEDDLTIMGPNGPIDEKVIDDLVKKNCKASLDEVLDEAAGLFPIKSTRGGFCMRLHPVKECETDVELDPVFCSYDECPNRAHLYYNIAQNWPKAEEEFEVLKYNIEIGKKNFSQKQAYILHNTLDRKIKPELKELEKQMEKGDVVEKHPELEEIINNLDDIKKKIVKMEEVIDKVCAKHQ